MRKESKGATVACLLRPWLLGVTALLAALSVQAAGLGPVRGEAIIGEPLYVEIPLLGMNETTLSAECFRINHPAQVTDAENFPRNTRVKLIKQGSESMLVVTTRQIMRTPIVEFRVEMGCGFNVSREYLFLASPQRVQQKIPAQDPVLPGSQAITTQDSPSPGITAAAAIPRSLPDGLKANIHIVDKPMRLEELSRMYFPGPLRRDRFMRWVVEVNPLLFQDATNLRNHQLKKGVTVLVPIGVPPRRPGDHQGNHGQLKFLDPATDESAPLKANPKAVQLPPPNRRAATEGKTKSKQDRLQISGGAENTVPRGAKGLSFLSDRLSELEGKQATDKTRIEERFKQMESSLVELSSYVEKLEARVKESEAQLKAERENARDARQSLHIMQLLLAILGGGLLGVLVLSTLQKKYRKDLGAESSIPMPDIPTTLVEKTAPVTASATVKPSPDTSIAPSFHKPPPVITKPAPEPAPKPAPKPEQKPATEKKETAAPIPANNRTAWDFDPIHSIDLNVEAPSAPPPKALLEIPSQENPEDTALLSKEDEARITLELVDVMVSMGLTDSAAETLAEHMHEKPRQSPLHWLKLLELFRQLGREEDFERTASDVRKYFNIHPPKWNSDEADSSASLEDYPHIIAVLCQLWNTDDCVNFLYDLITDNRGGAREGFPLAVAEEILLLIDIRAGES